MKKKRFVKIYAVDKKYLDTPFPFMPIFDSDANTYLTGQHIDAERPETANTHLTVKEMTGETPLSEQKLKKFPYIINPKNEYPLINGMILNITQKPDGTYENVKDGSLYEMYVKYGYRIARSRKTFRKGYDFFYIQDEIEEAREAVSIDDKIFEAMKCIKEKTNVSSYKDVALLLSYKIKGFFLNIDNKDELVIQNKLFEVCKKNPDEVIECFTEQAKDDLVILKLADKNIIQKKGTDFFDGDRYIGNSVRSVQSFMRDPSNRQVVDKWTRLLNKEEKEANATPAEKEMYKKEEKEKYEKSLEELSIAELRKKCAQAKIWYGHYKEEEDKSKIIKLLVDKY